MEHYKNTYIPILINEIFKPVFNETQIEIIREYFKAQAEADAAQAEAKEEAQAEAKKEAQAELEKAQAKAHAAQAAAQAALAEAQKTPETEAEEAQLIINSIFDVENNFLEIFFDKDNSKYDFGITKILKGEIFDITATSKNNELGELKSRNFKCETSLKDIYDELNYIKQNTQDDKSEKRELRLNFINNCIQLDKENLNVSDFNESGSFNTLFKYLTAYINGSNTIGISNEQFLVKNSGGNIFKLYAELLYLIFENKEIPTNFQNMVAIQEAEADAARAKEAAQANADTVQTKEAALAVASSNMDTIGTTPRMPNLFENIQNIMINMFHETSSPDSERYSIYNSLRNNMRLIMLQNYSDIDSYIIQNTVTEAEPMETEAPAPAPAGALAPAPAPAGAGDNIVPMDTESSNIIILPGKILELLDNNEPELAQTNSIKKIIDSIHLITNINVKKKISDTLDDGINNIIEIKALPDSRKKTGYIKSNFNNTLKEINSIIDNYDKIVRKQVKEKKTRAQAQAPAAALIPVPPAPPEETAGFILFRIKSYNKILGFNTEDTKINYNIKELLIKLELINELNKEIVKNINNPEYNYLPSYNNLDNNVRDNKDIPSPLYPQVFQADFLKINIDNSQDITNKILGHLFLKSLQYEKELMRISTDTNSRKLLISNNLNNNIENLHEIFKEINTNINPAVPAVPADFRTLSSLLNSNSLIEAMIKALNAFNIKTKEFQINYNEQYNNNANEIDGKMVKTLLGQTGDDIKDAYNIMITYIHNNITPEHVKENFKNQLLNFIAIKTSDKIEI